MTNKTNILTVKANKEGYVKCPFCYDLHKHGKLGGNGYRVPNCTAILINTPLFRDTGWHYKEDGYYVVFE